MLQEVTSDELINRLRTDPRFGDLFVRTLESARTAGWEAKRQAMGRVVVQALRDDEAAIDDSGRLLSALNELEAPDFAALARLHETGLHRSPEKGIRLEEVEGLDGSLGLLLRHGAIVQSSGYGALVYRSTSVGERLLALVSMAP